MDSICFMAQSTKGPVSAMYLLKALPMLSAIPANAYRPSSTTAWRALKMFKINNTKVSQTYSFNFWTFSRILTDCKTDKIRFYISKCCVCFKSSNKFGKFVIMISSVPATLDLSTKVLSPVKADICKLKSLEIASCRRLFYKRAV